MKLLTRITRSYLYISLGVFIISGWIVYRLLDDIFISQIDDTLKVERLLIEQTINYSDSVPDFRQIFGHMIDVTIYKTPRKSRSMIHDTLMYDPAIGEFASFRHLEAENTSIRNKGYTINIYKPLNEKEILVAEILLTLVLVFLSLMIILVIANYFIARRVWVPFYRILGQLGRYEIDQAHPLQPGKSDIHEFDLLSGALTKMSSKISQDYQSLKEFNEHASHELQTPLAIIKSKMELMIQDESLNENQFRLVSGALEATNRISKLNQGLLLISKIDNNQFSHTDPVDIRRKLEEILDHFSEMIQHKELTVTTDFQDQPALSMHPSLADTFFSNLISNAIKHNIHKGFIEITCNSERITVSNSGHPLKTDPSVLFDRFRKSDQNADSVGLGLSIVKRIATLYSLKISYEYEAGIHTLTIRKSILQN